MVPEIILEDKEVTEINAFHLTVRVNIKEISEVVQFYSEGQTSNYDFTFLQGRIANIQGAVNRLESLIEHLGVLQLRRRIDD